MEENTRKCPKCNKKMIQCFSNLMYPTNPPQRPWIWRCGCGHTKKGGVVTAKMIDKVFYERWRLVNGIV